MTLAVVKPDHFGDLILSSAAIRAVLARYPDAAVFVAGSNLTLARYLFGDAADLRAVSFPHLSKAAARAGVVEADFRPFDRVLFLRNDGQLAPSWAELRCRDYVFPIDTQADHQSIIDFAVVAPQMGGYDIEAAHFGAGLASVRDKAGRAPAHVGFAIGSGFHANTWPAARWIALGRRLLAEGRSVRVFCGPSERTVGTLIVGTLGLGSAGLVVGGDDIAAFMDEAARIDWFVASDGGTAHLCGLAAPVTSIFGPSPFRRYAPFGRWNRVLTQELDCSPCCQWASKLVNGCLSVECMAGIGVEPVLLGLGVPHVADIEPGSVAAGDGCMLYYGVSHLGLETKIEERLAA